MTYTYPTISKNRYRCANCGFVFDVFSTNINPRCPSCGSNAVDAEPVQPYIWYYEWTAWTGDDPNRFYENVSTTK